MLCTYVCCLLFVVCCCLLFVCLFFVCLLFLYFFACWLFVALFCINVCLLLGKASALAARQWRQLGGQQTHLWYSRFTTHLVLQYHIFDILVLDVALNITLLIFSFCNILLVYSGFGRSRQYHFIDILVLDVTDKNKLETFEDALLLNFHTSKCSQCLCISFALKKIYTLRVPHFLMSSFYTFEFNTLLSNFHTSKCSQFENLYFKSFTLLNVTRLNLILNNYFQIFTLPNVYTVCV